MPGSMVAAVNRAVSRVRLGGTSSNLIALTLCRIVSVEENVLEVESIDAFPDTPVLDMKPFIGGYDSTPDARLPEWVRHNSQTFSPK